MLFAFPVGTKDALGPADSRPPVETRGALTNVQILGRTFPKPPVSIYYYSVSIHTSFGKRETHVVSVSSHSITLDV